MADAEDNIADAEENIADVEDNMADADEPECIEKTLLAEDIAYYFIHGKFRDRDLSRYDNCVDTFKELAFNGFYEAILRVFEHLKETRDYVTCEDFKYLKIRKQLNKECFKEYALGFRRVLLAEDFETMCFLRYCLYVAGMAAKFHNNGVDDAYAMAVEMLKMGFPEGCLPEEFWEIFYKAVNKYVAEDCPKTDTKSGTSASFMSDSE